VRGQKAKQAQGRRVEVRKLGGIRDVGGNALDVFRRLGR
jgi:hypothetical protein